MVLLTMSAVRGSVGLDADPWVASDGVALLVCLYKAAPHKFGSVLVRSGEGI